MTSEELFGDSGDSEDEETGLKFELRDDGAAAEPVVVDVDPPPPDPPPEVVLENISTLSLPFSDVRTRSLISA